MLPKKPDFPISIRLSISIVSMTSITIPFPMITLSGMVRRNKQSNPRRNCLRDVAIPYDVRKVLIQCIQTIGCETFCLNHSEDLIEIASIVRFTEMICPLGYNSVASYEVAISFPMIMYSSMI